MKSFALSFELADDAAGWATAKLRIGSTTHETPVSHLTADPLGSLCQALIDYIWPDDTQYFLFGKPQSAAELAALRTREFTWEDEPGGWRWTLQPHGANAVAVKLELLTSHLLLADSICSLREMAGACAACIERLLLTHGIVGYRLKWKYGDLPLSQYLLLKRWLDAPQFDARTTPAATWTDDLASLDAHAP